MSDGTEGAAGTPPPPTPGWSAMPPAPTPPPAPGRPPVTLFGALDVIGLLGLLVLIPLTFVVTDKVVFENQRNLQRLIDPDATLFVAVFGLVVLALLIGALVRISPVGAIVNGVVWGLGPMLLALADQRRLIDLVADLPSLTNSSGLLFSAHLALPGGAVLGGLLIGSGVAGLIRRRWLQRTWRRQTVGPPLR